MTDTPFSSPELLEYLARGLVDDPDQVKVAGTFKSPINGYFTGLADPGANKFGLLHYTAADTSGQGGTSVMVLWLVNTGMPPAPADKLDARDTDILLNWCSKPLP